jgi:hypothetical protein
MLVAGALGRAPEGQAIVAALTRASAGAIPALADLMAPGGRNLALAADVATALPSQHAAWPLDVLAAARAVVRELPSAARYVERAGRGGPFDPAQLRADLERLGAAAAELEPPATMNACKRCGSRRRDTERDSGNERYHYNHHCLACGYVETEIGDVTLSAAMAEAQKPVK